MSVASNESTDLQYFAKYNYPITKKHKTQVPTYLFLADIGTNYIIQKICGDEFIQTFTYCLRRRRDGRNREFLKNEGCDEIQGFLYYRPMCREDFEKLMSMKYSHI